MWNVTYAQLDHNINVESVIKLFVFSNVQFKIQTLKMKFIGFTNLEINAVCNLTPIHVRYVGKLLKARTIYINI